jgi:HSP20 family protein
MAKASKKTSDSPMIKQDSNELSFSSQVLSRLEDMEKRFEQMFSSNWLKQLWNNHKEDGLPMPFEGRTPKVDIIDRDNDVLLKAELPGVKKEDIDVSLNESYVTIKGSTHAERKEEKGDYYRSEISSGSFSRTMALPCEVNVDKCAASFKDGVLELTMPKSAKAKKKSVKIK